MSNQIKEAAMQQNSEVGAMNGFRRRKILVLGEVAKLIHRTVHTARRKLKVWKTHNSYNQNGRYYTLPDVPEFDANGLKRVMPATQVKSD